MTRKYSYTVLITLVGVLSACESDDSPAPDLLEERVKLLTNDWLVTFFSLDGLDQTGMWKDFTLMLKAGQSYSATNVPTNTEVVWPITGNYTFPNADDLNRIERQDGISILINTVSTSSLTISFNLDIEQEGGRVAAVNGEWIFMMKPN